MRSYLFLFTAAFCAVYALADSVNEPECIFQDNVAACCLKVGLNVFSKKICLKYDVDVEKSTGHVKLYVGKKSLQEKNLVAGPSCWGLPPPFSAMNSCINVYHLVFDPKNKMFETCTLWSVGKLLQVRFGCIKLINGVFSHHSNIQPEDYGLINVSGVGGKLKWKIEAPKKIKGIWNKLKDIFSSKKEAIKKFIEKQ